MHNDGHARAAVVLDNLLEGRPRVAAVGADRVQERLHHHRLAPRQRLPAVHEAVRLRRDRDLRAADADQARAAPDDDREEQKRGTMVRFHLTTESLAPLLDLHIQSFYA